MRMNREFSQKPGGTFWTAAWTILLVAGLSGWLVLLFAGGDPARTWRALLVNFIYFTPLASGMVAWSAIVTAAKGRWAGHAESLSWKGLGFLVPSFLILVALWIGSGEWAPWHGEPTHLGTWLSAPFLFIRDLAALALIWGFARWHVAGRSRGKERAVVRASLFILVYCTAFTLIAFDLVMALNPDWHSSIFGGYFFISSLYLAVTFWTFLVTLEPGYGPDLRHDLGKLILAFSILTTYFLFMQLLVIWYENIPDETTYIVRRMNYPEWKTVSSLIIGIVYLGPLVLLLSRRAKRSRFCLGAVSVLLLLGLWFERWWMVAPAFLSRPALGWAEFAAFAGMLGAFGVGLQTVRTNLPPAPEEEQRS